MGGKVGAWAVMETYDPCILSSTFFQKALSGATASKVKNFEGLPIYTYILGIWGKIFQVLEAEAQQTTMISPEYIKRTKGEGFKVINHVVLIIKPTPEELYLSGEGDTMTWLRKWNHRNQ